MAANEPTAGVTAFIDILGFGGRVLGASEAADVLSIRDAVRVIRNAFDHEPEDELTLESHKIYDKKVIAFSDSVIINTPLESTATDYSGSFDPIMSEISSLALGQAICIENGILLRGGVDLGWWYQEEGIVISQSLTRAYYQESRAKYPVIAITSNLYDYLSSHPDRNYYAKSIDPLNSFERIDFEDGHVYFLDYLSIAANPSLGIPRRKSGRCTARHRAKSAIQCETRVAKRVSTPGWHYTGIRFVVLMDNVRKMTGPSSIGWRRIITVSLSVTHQAVRSCARN